MSSSSGDVRDIFLGLNRKGQNVTAALALARDCKHPDAEWLTSIFQGKDISTEEGARKVFLNCDNDARALCFAWMLSDGNEDDLSLLRRAAEMGNAFACSRLCWKVRFANKEEAFHLAHLATAHHERDGFYWLGFCFLAGIGCEKDLNSAEENYLIAAELGLVDAAETYGCLLGESDPACWLWWSRTALRGWPNSFLYGFSKQVDLFSLVLEMQPSCF